MTGRGGKGRPRGAGATGTRQASANGGMADTWVNGHVAHFRTKKVRCNKPGCKKCPHGPYLYMVYRDANGRVKEKYMGKPHQ